MEKMEIDLSNIRNAFSQFEVLQGLTTKDLMNKVLPVSEKYKYIKDDIVFDAGSIPKEKELFFILSGVVSVEIKVHNQFVSVHEAKAGELFGEISFLLDVPRTARMRAKTNEVVLFKFGPAFEVLVEMDDQIGKVFYRHISIMLADRLRESDVKQKTQLLNQILTSFKG